MHCLLFFDHACAVPGNGKSMHDHHNCKLRKPSRGLTIDGFSFKLKRPSLNPFTVAQVRRQTSVVENTIPLTTQLVMRMNKRGSSLVRNVILPICIGYSSWQQDILLYYLSYHYRHPRPNPPLGRARGRCSGRGRTSE